MKLELFVEQIKKLPPAPQILPKLMKLLASEDSSFDEITQLVSVDLSLTAQVLRLSNSAYYGMGSKTYDLEEAIQRIGFKEVYKLIALICSKELMDHEHETFGLEKGELWRYSLGSAIVMEDLAADLGVVPTTAYTIGLLHTIGKIAINQASTGIYKEVFEKLESEEGKTLAEAEKEVLGFTNAQVASFFLKKWDFTAEIYWPIEYQFKPTIAEGYKKEACMLHLSIWIASHLGVNGGRGVWAFELNSKAIKFLKFSEMQVQEYLLKAHDNWQKAQELLSI
ncbi:MAG: HDOD domain-containing protein [Opitutales bacterium]